MSIAGLQRHLAATSRYQGKIDGLWGPLTQAAVIAAFEDGPDTALTEQDYIDAASRLGVQPWTIMAFAEVEAAGAGFFAGKPKILPEPHRFARITRNRFNKSDPTLSYAKWGARPYPRTQDDRYRQLIGMIRLDAAAGFSACSYGKFQILGENYGACGYETPWAFAFAQAYDEPTQLRTFEKFMRTTELLPSLRAHMWADVARRYNGPAYAKNKYDLRLAQAARLHQQRMEG